MSELYALYYNLRTYRVVINDSSRDIAIDRYILLLLKYFHEINIKKSISTTQITKY